MLHLLLAFGAAGTIAPATSPFTGSVTPPEARPPAPALPPASPARPPRQRDDDDDDDREGRVASDDPIVVTGRRLDAARTGIDAALGATVYALSNDAVENRPGGETGSVAQILAQGPGVGGSAGGGLAVRGSRAVQVRINDVVVPEAIADPSEHLSARLAETTRLMTGTLPAQFGFAPGGVVSVTTKSGLYQHGGQAELFAGSSGFLEPALEWSGSAAGTSLFASGSLERDRSTVSVADGVRARDGRRTLGGLAFADRVLGPHDRVSLLVGGSGERHRFGATALGPGDEQSSDGYAVATFQHSDDGFTLQASLFTAVATDSTHFLVATRERRAAFGVQVDASARIGSRHTLRAGLIASRIRVRGMEPPSSPAAAARMPVALYAQDEWQIARGVTLDPGVRVEWLRGFAGRPVAEPRANLVWSPDDDVTFHAGYARYAAAPALRSAGAARLPDEEDDYFDAGAQHKLGALTLGIDGYWRQARNALTEHRAPGAAVATPFAFQRARLRGLELTATYARRGTTAWANLALSRATGRSLVAPAGLFPAATLAAVSARSVPFDEDRPASASAGVTHRFDELTITGDVLVSSGAVRTVEPTHPNGGRSPAVALLGLAAVYRARLAGHPTDLRIDLTNLGDVREPATDSRNLEGGWTRQTRGRAILLGIEQGF